MESIRYYKHMNSIGKTRKGFTLIELLIVLTVIGLLMAGLALNLPTQAKNARDNRRKVDIEQIRAGLEMYRTDQANGNYPNGNFASLTAALTNYVNPVPLDPTNVAPQVYTYIPSPVGCTNVSPNFCTSYTVTYRLERTGITISLTPQTVAK
jgi:general secretion pathway protein G